MPIEAIGSTLGASSSENLTSTTLNQEDFLRLFLTELNFQDPLEPIDNREFLAQIASFTGLEQARQTTETIENLVFLTSVNQSVGLLGRSVQINSVGSALSGSVTAIRFSEEGPLLTVQLENESFLTDVSLSQISLVRTVE